MLLKLRKQLFLALIFFILTLAQQYLFLALKGIPIVPLSFGKYVGVLIFFSLLSFIKTDFLRYIFMSMILILNAFQMGHLSYFGTQVLPAEIYLLFTQFGEVHGTVKEDFRHVLIPLMFTLVPLFLGWMAHKRLKSVYSWRGIEILVCLYVIYNPVRTYVTGNTWGRQPSTRELTGVNLYLTLSYFTGRILPHKLSQSSAGTAAQNSSMLLTLTPGSGPKWDKIVIVLGESLTPRHMQLFGYSRPTTPFLELQKDSPDFFYTTGLSGGVSTDIAVAYFLNLGFGSAGSIKAAKGDQCLFRLAKTKEFKTHFISIQSSEQLRYISPYLCASNLDDLRSLEDIAPETVDHQAASDRDLLGTLQEFTKVDGKDFLILHQRGSHSPWNLRFSQQAKLFSGSSDSRTDDYDNSVVEFDLFWKELHTILSNSAQKILLVYLSDHGESLGDNGRWGHGFVEPVSFEVPIIIKSFNQALPANTKKLPKFLTHFNLGLYITKELGYELNQKPEILPLDYEVYGNDIDGFAGKAAIKFNEKGYSFEFSP
ncbi:MAG TPA: sulfatase-like hydrolase/transferase [Bacteriovoracaceae bacterium]|nr:sulfatase-like hydrolase/transferase [Bacteriovoracaceae bacterium]